MSSPYRRRLTIGGGGNVGGSAPELRCSAHCRCPAHWRCCNDFGSTRSSSSSSKQRVETPAALFTLIMSDHAAPAAADSSPAPTPTPAQAPSTPSVSPLMYPTPSHPIRLAQKRLLLRRIGQAFLQSIRVQPSV